MSYPKLKYVFVLYLFMDFLSGFEDFQTVLKVISLMLMFYIGGNEGPNHGGVQPGLPGDPGAGPRHRLVQVHTAYTHR